MPIRIIGNKADYLSQSDILNISYEFGIGIDKMSRDKFWNEFETDNFKSCFSKHFSSEYFVLNNSAARSAFLELILFHGSFISDIEVQDSMGSTIAFDDLKLPFKSIFFIDDSTSYKLKSKNLVISIPIKEINHISGYLDSFYVCLKNRSLIFKNSNNENMIELINVEIRNHYEKSQSEQIEIRRNNYSLISLFTNNKEEFYMDRRFIHGEKIN